MKKTVAIIGGGPTALMLAAKLDEKKFNVSIYEKNNAPGRKFLVAGKGGFNLTHAEPVEQFVTRYTPSVFFEKLIASFSNADLRNWLDTIGVPTYVGSSKRVFPVKGMKPIEVLNAILNELKNKKVKILTQHIWKGWSSNNDELVFEVNEQQINVKADIIVFALGGASWKKTGSDGSWAEYFTKKGVDVIPFQSSNCAFEVKWPNDRLKIVEGQSLKNIVLKCLDKEKKGEVVITAFGLEGGAIYALSTQIRQQLNKNETATVFLDLKPSLSVSEIIQRLKIGQGRGSLSKRLEDKLKLNKTQLALLKVLINKEDFIQPEQLAKMIKSLPLQITGMAVIDEAISTVGGVSLNEIDTDFQLKKLPGHYVIGEMLDWDAPTGGYLLQACFSMANALAACCNVSEVIPDNR
jgi:uncharacterized flavoprotein (TIGR03862 family)